jgi:hypothetical protein
LVARLISLNVPGAEPRLVVPPLRDATARTGECVNALRPRPSPGFAALRVAVDEAGVTSLSPPEGPESAVVACARAALSGLPVPRRPPTKAFVVPLVIMVLAPESEVGLPELAKRESLAISPDGTCQGQVFMTCPPHKSCPGPERRAVKCPVEHDLPALVSPGSATRRLDVAVSGGKPGSVGERLAFSRGPDGCSLYKESTTPGEPVEERADEVVDLPCADFERAWSAGVPLVTRRASGTPNAPDSVTRSVMRWVRGADGVPIVTEVRWTGRSPLDTAFESLASIVGPLAAGRGKLSLSRF